MKMQRLLILILCFVFSSEMYAAVTTVVGSVRERDGGRAVEFANVSAVDSTGRIAAICATDESGDFILHVRKEGRYRINVTFVGYATWEKEVVCAGEGIDLGRIRLKRSSEELAGAGITAKTLIRKEADRITYDVLEDPDAGRLNMAAFMSKIPGLEKAVKNGDLEYKGVSVTKILLNDKENPVINESRQYPMEFIRADYMSKIELILPDSPEYGNTEPMLVVTLSRPLPYGIAAQIKASASSRNEYSASADAVANTPIVGVGVAYGYRYAHNPADIYRTERNLDQTETATVNTVESYEESRTETQGHNLGLNLFRSVYKDKIDLAVSLNTSRSESWSNSFGSNVQSSGETRTESTNSTSGHSVSPFRLNGGFSANYSWGRSNNVDLKYTFKHNESSGSEVMNYSYMPGDRLNNSFSSSMEHNVAASLKMRIARKIAFRVEAGFMHRNYYDSSTYGDGTSGGMEYVQGVAYADAMVLGSFFDRKLGYSLVMNLENVNNKGVNKTSGRSLDYNEFNVVPRLNLSWRAWNTGSFGLSYSARSRRPRQEMLDPYRDETDPYNVRVGNPDLRGEVSHRVSLSMDQEIPVKWMDDIGLSVSYSVTPNAIEQVSYTDMNNVRTITYENMGKRDALGISFDTRFNITKKIYISLRANATRNSYRFRDGQENTYWSFMASENLNMDLKYCYISQALMLVPMMSAQTRNLWIEPMLELSVSRYWEKIRLGTSITCADLLYGRSYRKSVIAGDGFVNTTNTMRQGRYIYFSVYWRIGKFKNSPSVKHESYDMD